MMRRPLFVDEARPTGSVPYQARDPIACGTHDMDTWSETDLDATKNKVPTVARVDMGLSPLLSQGGGGSKGSRDRGNFSARSHCRIQVL